MVNQKRVRILKEINVFPCTVTYWMSRDQRAHDNWALIFAQEIALEMKQPLTVVFCLTDSFLGATKRHYAFMIKGLMEVEEKLRQKNIPFQILQGEPHTEILKYVKDFNVSALITDFDPLRIKTKWKDKVAANIHCQFFEVDTHNIVPCWVTSQKQEYGAYTIRPKIYKNLKNFNDVFPDLTPHPFCPEKIVRIQWNRTIKDLGLLNYISQSDTFTPGEKAAQSMLKTFINEKIHRYQIDRNDPNKDCQSNLSPYLHFGHISAQRIYNEVIKYVEDTEGKRSFLEELIVRRELSDNFCFYNRDYDSFQGFPEWAKKTLHVHRNDLRKYIYDLSTLENAGTHDPLWNAAQKEMVKKGKMHGYMRMYWAKKILEWSETPEDAVEKAIYLNDRYEIDGRDPNGYTGIAWSIGGVHDRPWQERDIFGKIRYMSYNGCKRKFDIKSYIEKVESL